jgi:hypothetical protein
MLLSFALFATAAGAEPPRYALPAMTTPDFCARLQEFVEGSKIPVRNIVHTDYAAFVSSKPELSPLTTQQHVEYATDDPQRPARISCKLKTADHLNEAFGAGSAADRSRSCREAHQQMVLAVWASMTRREMLAVKYHPDVVMLDADDVRYTGSSWKEAYQSFYLGDDGKPHVVSKSLVANWTDWRWKLMPARFRGTHYCHLVAPETLRAVMAGAVQPQPGPVH